MKNLIFIIICFIVTVNAKTFKNIEFTGDIDLITGEFDRATLLKVCQIEYPALYKFWKKSPTFASEEADACEKHLVEYAKSQGYYKATVKTTFEKETLSLELQKNQPILVNSIRINSELERFSLLKKKERFKTNDFTQTKEKIIAFLEENGYPAYHMNAKAYVDLASYHVDVNISVDKGKQHFFATTKLVNESSIDEALIKEQIVYQENELYNILKLEESYEKIYQLGVFEKIVFDVDVNETRTTVPVIISLKEGDTKEFASNIGYDTQDGFRAGVAYFDHNFLGDLKVLKTGFQLAQRGYELNNELYTPRVELPLVEKVTVRNELEVSRWDYDAYVEKLLLERLTIAKKLWGLQHDFGFQLEHSKIISGVPIFLAGDYFISSLFYKVLIDKRDSKLDAKNGYYTSLYLEKAASALGSEIDYLKTLFEARYLKSFDRMVLASKVKVGTISNDTPLFKHFFIGGAMSNRGYEYRDLGEKVSGYPIGGISMLDISLEGRYYITPEFSFVSFIDSSKLSNKVYSFGDKWYNSYGIGVRYLSVIGPLRFDIGYPQEGGFAVHLGIGQVF